MNLKEILDYRETEKLFKSLSATCGLDVALFDTDGKEVFSVRSENCICNFIRADECGRKIAYSGAKAAELKSAYIYETPCGLIMCISPVAPEGKTLAYIACGPARLWDDDEYFRNEFYSKCRGLGFSAEQAGFAPENVKQVSCNYLTGLAGMLAVTVEYMAKETGRYLKRKDELGRMATEQLKMQAELRLKEARTGYRKYPIELEKELIAYVQLGDKVRARAIINNFLGEIFAYACGDLDIIKAKLFEFTAFLSRAAVEAGAPLNTMADTIKKSVTLLAENVDYVSICTTAVEIMNDFLDTVYENRKRRAASEHLSKAVKIINERYYEELTLESLASKVFVSAYYLSHLFRDEMDITFTDYLNKVRVDRAKEFLSEGCGVAEAAEKTGFNDPAYFMKIFKRYVGITPAKYKKAVTGFSGGSF